MQHRSGEAKSLAIKLQCCCMGQAAERRDRWFLTTLVGARQRSWSWGSRVHSGGQRRICEQMAGTSCPFSTDLLMLAETPHPHLGLTELTWHPRQNRTALSLLLVTGLVTGMDLALGDVLCSSSHQVPVLFRCCALRLWETRQLWTTGPENYHAYC